MLQVLQNLKNGETEVLDVPVPGVRAGHLKIRTRTSLVSAGTERSVVEFGSANYLQKALQQPERVREVLSKIRTDGLTPTIEAVRARLDQPTVMGYCNVGEVLEVGEGVEGFKTGDRVVSNGPHAEVVVVPANLCAVIPQGVAEGDAVFTVLSAIALQGIRLIHPTLGEKIVVLGLGLIGLIAVQILRANGCAVLGVDTDPERVALAARFGAETVDLSKGEDQLKAAENFSRGRGVDAVLICAATSSSDVVHNAATMSRKRGRIVLVGVVGLELSRSDFYEKELTFQVSCSYGPGRYDPDYEDKGRDYPIGFVRWTEQRNFEAVLDLMVSNRLDVAPLVSHRYAVDNAAEAYRTLLNARSLGIVLNYPADPTSDRRIVMREQVLRPPVAGSAPAVSFIGAGNFASRVLVPAFAQAGARLRAIASNKGVNAALVGRKAGFEIASSNVPALLADKDTDLVVVVTPHASHAGLAAQTLAAGRAVFVEKPLAISMEQLESLDAAYGMAASPFLMVGFNRRFSPHTERLRAHLSDSEPKAIVMTINAGEMDAEHWTQDPDVGGGRIIGEACHFIDLARVLANAPISQVRAMDAVTPRGASLHDTASISLSFENGSTATIHYLANGNRSFPKERIEVFQGGRILQLDNFRVLRGFGVKGFSSFRTRSQDKGHIACVRATLECLKSGRPSPIPYDELMEVSRATIAAKAQLTGS
jgi:predicted dehydrogenase